jgi:hypothetical protein
VRKHGAVDANGAKKVGVHKLAGLFGSDGFGEPEEAVASVVDSDIDAAGMVDYGAHGSFDGSVIGDVELEDVEMKRFPFGERAKFGGVLSVASAGITHGGENGVTAVGERLSEKPAESGARAGDEDDLVRSH